MQTLKYKTKSSELTVMIKKKDIGCVEIVCIGCHGFESKPNMRCNCTILVDNGKKNEVIIILLL